MPQTAPNDLADIERDLRLCREAERLGRLWPSDNYVPHSISARGPRKGLSSGQLQFHQSKHATRVAAPGNGYGGTTMMAVEMDHWCRGVDRWGPTPKPPITGVWFAPESRQFSMVLDELRKVAFGPLPRLYESGFGGPRLMWPNGSIVYITTYERGWEMSQGTQPNLVAFDEQPPEPVWNEMQQRRRAKIGQEDRACRFMCKATQTEGWSWMAERLYLPWLKFHEDRGLDQEAAMACQLHPDLWLWPTGSIHDNASMAEASVLEYERRPWPTEIERQVRLFGGFKSWSGHCVFDIAGLQRLEERRRLLEASHGAGKRGTLLYVGKARDEPP